MNAHAPKVGALRAYALNLLSDDGTRRIERHLATCALCRDALAAVRLGERLSGDARELRYEPRWEKMELALARAAREEAKRIRQRSAMTTAGVAAVVLAAAAVLVLALRPASTPSPTAGRAPTPALPTRPATPRDPAPPDPPPTLAAVVTAVSGAVTARAASDASVGAVAIGDRLDVGTTLATATAARVHAHIEEGTGFALSESTVLSLTELRHRRATLTLETGTVSSRVHPLAGDERYVVVAGAYEVHVRGTLFAVTRRGDDVRVRVDEGAVDVLRAGEVVQSLRAPATWSSAPTREAVASIDSPRGTDAASLEWPILLAPPATSFERWLIDGNEFSTLGELAMRAAPGRLVVSAFDRIGREFRVVIDLTAGAEPLRLDPARLRRIDEEPATGTIDIAAVNARALQLKAGLQQCYNLELRRQPDADLAPRLNLRMTIGLSGNVTNPRFVAESGEAPPALIACLTSRVRGWVLPPARSAPVSVNVPMQFVVDE